MKHKLMYFIPILLLLFGCAGETPHEFYLGEEVCFKGGGPVGIVQFYLFDNTVYVRFYLKNKFTIASFWDFQLLHKDACKDR